MTFRVETNIREINKRLKTIPSKVTIPSMNAALNRATTAGRTQAVRSVSKAMGLKQKLVRERTRVIRSSFKRLTGAIVLTGRPLNMIRFNARQIRKGVSSSAYGQRRLTKGAFIANSGRTVFVRTNGKMGSRKAGRNSTVTKHNQQIKPVYGPGIADTAAQPDIAKDITKVINRTYRKTILRELRRRSGRELRVRRGLRLR